MGMLTENLLAKLSDLWNITRTVSALAGEKGANRVCNCWVQSLWIDAKVAVSTNWLARGILRAMRRYQRARTVWPNEPEWHRGQQLGQTNPRCDGVILRKTNELNQPQGVPKRAEPKNPTQ